MRYASVAMGLAAGLFLLAGPVNATTINTPWAPDGPGTGELNLYQIYNAVYGTSFDAATVALLQVDASSDQLFWNSEGYDVEFVARYAAQGQTFGYINNADQYGSNPASVQHDLFTVNSFIGVDAPVDWSSAVHIAGGANLPIAFYDRSGSNTFYSVQAWNSGGADHMVMLLGVDGTVLLAFEDRKNPGSDRDFNDLVVQMRIRERPNDPGNNPVPEPATLTLLGIGLTSLMLKARFRA